ncbi:hypothetical protein Peur_059845 [Populus x canadensis]
MSHFSVSMERRSGPSFFKGRDKKNVDAKFTCCSLNRVHSQGCPAMQHHMTGNLNSRAQAPSPSEQANYNPEPLFVLPLFKQHKFFSLIGLLHADTAFSNLFRKMPVRSGSV